MNMESCKTAGALLKAILEILMSVPLFEEGRTLRHKQGHSYIDVTHGHYQSAITRYHLNTLAIDQHQSNQFDIKNRA